MKNKKSINLVTLIAIVIIFAIVIGLIVKFTKYKKRDYEIAQIDEYKYFVVKEDKFGIIDAGGNKIVETKYDNVVISNPSIDVFICFSENNVEVLNKDGEILFGEYDNVEPLRLKGISSDLMYEKTVLKYSKDGKYGIIDLTGKKLTKPVYEEIDTLQFKEGELLVKKANKYGVININGTTLVDAKYDKIEADKYYNQQNGYKNAGYIVSNTTDEGYRYGYVDLKGKEIIQPIYNDMNRILNVHSDEVYIICAENGKYGLYKDGQKVIKNEYQSLSYSENSNTIIALKGKKYGVLSINGDVIVPFEYKQIDSTGEYLYAKMIDENIKVFDATGNETDIDENLKIIKIDNYEIYIDSKSERTIYNIYKDGKKITQDKYIYVQYLFDNYFIACNQEGKLGVIDDNNAVKIKFDNISIQKIDDTKMIETINNDTKITSIYSSNMNKICDLKDAIISNEKNYIKLYNENEVKYVSKDEVEVKNIQVYQDNGIFASKSGNKWGFVDKAGNKVVDYKYDSITEVNEYGYAGIKQNGKWGIINSQGEVIVQPKYEITNDNPIFIGEYYQVVYGNGEIYYTK